MSNIDISTNQNVYLTMKQQLDEIFTPPAQEADSNDGLEGSAYRKALLHAYLTEKQSVLISGLIFAACILHLMVWMILYLIGTVKIDTSYTPNSLLYCVVSSLIPLFNWVNVTRFKDFSFHNRKLFWLRFCMFHLAFMLTAFVYHHVGNLVIPLVVAWMKPTVSRSITMVKAFCRTLMFILSVVPGAIVFCILNHLTLDDIAQAKILDFEISQKLDLRSRESKAYAYDMQIVKNLKTGKQYTIKEKDRFLHALDDGSTGSGKTSSTFTPAIDDDFAQRLHNLEHQKMCVEQLVSNGRVKLTKPMEDRDFDIDCFEALDEKAKKELYKLKYKSPLASVIAIAPNEAFSDKIYDLANQKGMKVHRLDPMLTSDKHLKESFCGLNPLYIQPGLSAVEYMIEVNQRATLFADVMQAVYDKSGQSNPYFAGLNQNITTTVTAMILLCAPYMPEKFQNQGKVPVATDVQEVLNDFTKAKAYVKVFRDYYAEPGTHYDKQPNFGRLQYIYDVVNGGLLGQSSSQLFDQCQGLRNIINSLLGDPMIRNILCTQDSINLDQVLAKGEIVVVNYALNLGTNGITFGLFFLLSLINAAYRRPNPESERLPCFIYTDELPQLLHPSLESCFTLFRQYRMAMFVAIQSLSQLEKSRSTAFLKQVLLSNCAHHFVFGRAGVEDMEIYEALAGTKLRVNNMEGSDIRARKFQECTVITVDQGTPVDAFAGLVFFLPEYRSIKKKRYQVNWSRYYHGPASSTGPDHVLTDSSALKQPLAEDRLEKSVFRTVQPQVQEDEVVEVVEPIPEPIPTLHFSAGVAAKEVPASPVGVPDEDPDIPVAAQEPVLEPEIAIEEEMPPVDLQIDFKANDEGAEENTAECASETENSNMDAVPDSGTAGEGVSARPDMPNASAPSDKRKPARKKKNRSSKEKELEEPMPDVELDDISDLFGGFL